MTKKVLIDGGGSEQSGQYLPGKAEEQCHRAEIAHLFRRAGFGISGPELDYWQRFSYREVVDQIVHPESASPEVCGFVDEELHADLADRFFTAAAAPVRPEYARPRWLWRMVTTNQPFIEKVALAWHGLFATGSKYPIGGGSQLAQIETFRAHGLGYFGDLLLAVCQDPAMLMWLDNHLNKAAAPNENLGRELLELFSLGIGNYTENDVKSAAAALTGWSITPAVSPYPHGEFQPEFRYYRQDHDRSCKMFLERRGSWQGEDIVAMVSEHPATARFITHYLYRFFVQDEPDAAGVAEIDRLAAGFQSSRGDLASVLTDLFTSQHFRSAAMQHRKIKSPTELVVGFARQVLDCDLPCLEIAQLGEDIALLGQGLLDPPDVSGWPGGQAWITTATVMDRVDVLHRLIDANSAKIQQLVDAVPLQIHSPTELVGAVIYALGAPKITQRNQHAIAEFIRSVTDREDQVISVLAAITAAPEFNYC